MAAYLFIYLEWKGKDLSLCFLYLVALHSLFLLPSLYLMNYLLIYHPQQPEVAFAIVVWCLVLQYILMFILLARSLVEWLVIGSSNQMSKAKQYRILGQVETSH